MPNYFCDYILRYLNSDFFRRSQPCHVKLYALICTGLLSLPPFAISANQPLPVVDIHIGVIAGITGAGASYGAGIVQGAEMAVQEINAAGGINGRKIKLTIVDDTSDPARSAIVMRRLIGTSPDLIVGGWGSSQVLAHMNFPEQSAIPYIVVGATNPRITSPSNKWVFRVIQSDDVMAEQLAQLAITDLGLKRIAIIHDNNAYGTGNRDVFISALEKYRVKVLDVVTYNSSRTDFKTQLLAIKAINPDGIALFGTLPAAPKIMQQARALGITARFIGTGGLANEQLFAEASAASEGTILMSHFHEDSDAPANVWNKQYLHFVEQKKYKSPVRAAWEYRAIKYIAAPCLNSAGSDRVKLRNCIANWRGTLFGVNAESYFDQTGQLVQPVIAVEIHNQAFRLYTRPPK